MAEVAARLLNDHRNNTRDDDEVPTVSAMAENKRVKHRGQVDTEKLVGKLQQLLQRTCLHTLGHG